MYKDAVTFNDCKTVSLGAPNNPTQIEGYYLGSKNTPAGDYGPGVLYFFQTLDDGEVIGVWGKTVLNQIFQANDYKGQKCLVTFTGMIPPKKKGQRPAYGFRVQHDEDDRIDVSGISFASPVAPPDDEEDANEDYASHALPEKTYTRAELDAMNKAKVQARNHVNSKRF